MGNGSKLQSRIAAAVKKVSAKVSDTPGGFYVTFMRPVARPTSPIDVVTPTIPKLTFQLLAVDDQIKDVYAPGGAFVRSKRVLTFVAGGVSPQMGDKAMVKGRTLTALTVNTTSPGDTDLLYEVEVEL